MKLGLLSPLLAVVPALALRTPQAPSLVARRAGPVTSRAGRSAVALDAAAVEGGGLLDKFDSFKVRVKIYYLACDHPGQERKRATRRDVYDAVAWRKHRSTKRYFRALFNVFRSLVLKGISLELVFMGFLATAVTYVHTAGLASLAVPALPLTMTAPAVALLITFRTNQAYDRWWEARKIWGAVINKTRDLTRQSHWFKDPENARKMSGLAVAFSYALNAHCLKGTISDPSAHVGEHGSVDDKLAAEITPLIGEEATKEVLAAPHRPVEVCRLLTRCLANEALTPQLKARVDTNVGFYSDFGGMCDRIQKTPMPLVYTRHTARFLTMWLAFIPSALLGAGLGAGTVIASSLVISAVFLGIDEVAVLLEEPFSVLPMDSYCNGLRDLHLYAEFLPAPEPERPVPVYYG